jgi:hypothetical protein
MRRTVVCHRPQTGKSGLGPQNGLISAVNREIFVETMYYYPAYPLISKTTRLNPSSTQKRMSCLYHQYFPCVSSSRKFHNFSAKAISWVPSRGFASLAHGMKYFPLSAFVTFGLVPAYSCVMAPIHCGKNIRFKNHRMDRPKSRCSSVLIPPGFKENARMPSSAR